MSHLQRSLLGCCFAHVSLAAHARVKRLRLAPPCVQVVDHAWGSDVAPLGAQPDLITGADIVYEERCFGALVATLRALAAPHTLVVLAYRLRGASTEVMCIGF